MKIKYFFFVLFIGFKLTAQIIVFPDANLKARLLASDVTNSIANYIKIDSNDDGEIEVSEVQNIYLLNISSSGISDLTGLNYFNLSQLNCSHNTLTNLDGLIQQSLDRLNCSYNQLSHLSVANIPSLVDLNCSYNFIETLDLSSLGFTDSLNISNNYISSFTPPQYIVSLDIRNNNFNGFPVPYFAIEAILVFGGNPSDQLIYSGSWRTPKELFFSSDTSENVDLSNVPLSEYETFNQQPNFYFFNCSSLKSIKLNNNLVSRQYIGDLSIVNCDNLNYICADESEEEYFVQKLVELNLNDQVEVVTDCQLSNGNPEQQNQVSLFPNPVESILYINVNNAEILSISVYNMLGQLTLSASHQNSEIDVSSLSHGNYILKVVSDKGISTSRFIKK